MYGISRTQQAHYSGYNLQNGCLNTGIKNNVKLKNTVFRGPFLIIFSVFPSELSVVESKNNAKTSRGKYWACLIQAWLPDLTLSIKYQTQNRSYLYYKKYANSLTNSNTKAPKHSPMTYFCKWHASPKRDLNLGPK